jgi:hypothetical protein
MSALRQLAIEVLQYLPFKVMANASLAPWLTWQASALHRGFQMVHATVYLALRLLLRVAPATSTKFMPLTVLIPH